MFFRENCGFEKYRSSFAPAPRKKQAPPYLPARNPRISLIAQGETEAQKR